MFKKLFAVISISTLVLTCASTINADSIQSRTGPVQATITFTESSTTATLYETIMPPNTSQGVIKS